MASVIDKLLNSLQDYLTTDPHMQNFIMTETALKDLISAVLWNKMVEENHPKTKNIDSKVMKSLKGNPTELEIVERYKQTRFSIVNEVYPERVQILANKINEIIQ